MTSWGWLVAMSSAGLLAGVLGSPCVGSSTWLLGLPHRMAARFQETRSRSSSSRAWKSQNIISAVFFIQSQSQGLREFKEKGIKPLLHLGAACVCRREDCWDIFAD